MRHICLSGRGSLYRMTLKLMQIFSLSGAAQLAVLPSSLSGNPRSALPGVHKHHSPAQRPHLYLRPCASLWRRDGYPDIRLRLGGLPGL